MECKVECKGGVQGGMQRWNVEVECKGGVQTEIECKKKRESETDSNTLVGPQATCGYDINISGPGRAAKFKICAPGANFEFW